MTKWQFTAGMQGCFSIKKFMNLPYRSTQEMKKKSCQKSNIYSEKREGCPLLPFVFNIMAEGGMTKGT